MKIWKRKPIEAHEAVEYEPLTVLEILREMKDLSELMTSLAYSALILDNDPIGEEVEAMAQRMDWLKYQLRQTASLAVRTVDDATQVAGILQIGDASEHIANAAADMIEILDAKVQARPFLRHALDEADDRITTLSVPDDSPLQDRSIGTMRLESETGVRIIAMRRGKGWVYDPGANNYLRPGDHLLIRAQREGARYFRDMLHGLPEGSSEKTASDAPPQPQHATNVDAEAVRRVEGIITRMKDTSELMVDLAYSSVFYQSAGIAQEVDELEESVGAELTELQRLTLEAVRDQDLDVDHAIIVMRVAHAAENIANAALEIADVVLRDVDLHPILVEAIRDSDSSITKSTLAAASPFVDVSLRDLELESETGMRVLAVKRSGSWHTGVEGDFVMVEGDLLIAVGPEEAVEPFLERCAADAET